MKNIIGDLTWKKTVQLIEDKYGRHIDFRALKLIKEASTSPYQEGDDLVVPLRLKNFDLGDVIIDRGSFLSEQQRAEIVDIIKFLIEPQVYSIHLKSTEESLKYIKNGGPQNTNANLINIFQQEEPAQKLLSNVIHLKSHTEQSRRKVALKIHEMSKRNLFVQLEDILGSVSSEEDLNSLNDTTIFVADILQVNENIRKTLEQYLLKQKNANAGPILLIGSSLTMQSVENMSWNQSFKNDLLGFYFDIDRIPIAQQTSKEILELLFFNTDLESL